MQIEEMGVHEFLRRVLQANLVLRPLMLKQCKKLGIKVPKLILGRTKNEDLLGFTNGIGKVFINISVGDLEAWKSSLYHELRHIWQCDNHRDILVWCGSNPEYGRFGRFYRLCPAEIDARYAGKTHGKFLHGPIDRYTVQELKDMYQNGTFFSAMERLVRYYGVPDG